MSEPSERYVSYVGHMEHGFPPIPLDIIRGRTVHCDRAKSISLTKEQITELGLAEPHGIRQYGVKHGLQIAGRARDDLQHLRGCDLLLQGLGQLPRPRLHLLEQPCVLDGDYGLVSESSQQRDLLLIERSHDFAAEQEASDG